MGLHCRTAGSSVDNPVVSNIYRVKSIVKYVGDFSVGDGEPLRSFGVPGRRCNTLSMTYLGIAWCIPINAAQDQNEICSRRGYILHMYCVHIILTTQWPTLTSNALLPFSTIWGDIPDVDGHSCICTCMLRKRQYIILNVQFEFWQMDSSTVFYWYRHTRIVVAILNKMPPNIFLNKNLNCLTMNNIVRHHNHQNWW